MSKESSKPIENKDQLAKDLTRYTFFSSFTPDEISLLLYCAEKVDLGKDETVFKEGDTGKYFYAILSGQVAIRKEKSGKVLATLNPGDVFGEMAVLDNNPRSATATALEDARLFAFDGRRLLEDFPHLSVKLLIYLSRELCKRLREADLMIDRF
ncbi:MAG: cyclic nucleotide-binding domain-containing protein [Candidatus Glassbacteria bacterium]|nr:cyclic nucleotide-binding domain-containing protein [Candidatus Glassbacteria bacterium]